VTYQPHQSEDATLKPMARDNLRCEPGLHRIDNGWHHHEPIDSDDPLYSPEEATWGTWAILIGLALALIFMTALAIAPHI
jgi:hypothetical protein